MLDGQAYYDYIYQRLVLRHCDWKSEKFAKERNVVLEEWLSIVLDKIRFVYGFDLRKNAKINIEKFGIWRRELGLSDENDYVYAATCFVLFCCVVDKILDSRRFSQSEKETLCEELLFFWNKETRGRCRFPEIWELGAQTADFLAVQKKADSSRYLMLKDKIDRAFFSEIYLYEHSLFDFDETVNLYHLTDKSVEFVSASFEIAAYDSAQERMKEIANLIGELFWLIDDVCDFPADIEEGSMNSALIFCTDMSQQMLLYKRIEYAALHIDGMIQEMEIKAEYLGKAMGSEMYRFIQNELWDWTLDVRKRTAVVKKKEF